jgi:hypothetical protein
MQADCNGMFSLATKVKKLVFKHTLQEANSFADSLAEQGVRRQLEFPAWI